MPNYDPERIAVGMSHKIEALEFKLARLNTMLSEYRKLAQRNGWQQAVSLLDAMQEQYRELKER